jgi:hypothetical protein
MRRLLFLSSISGLVSSGCSDDCGPGGAPASGLLASSADVTLTYGNLSSGANNDCPDPMAPTGVVSLTVDGTQTDAAAILTLCIPRPDLLAEMDLPLGTGGVRIIDFNGDKDGCTFAFESTRPVTGTVHTRGMCDNGKNEAGYALGIQGNISLRRTCATMTDTIAVELDGLVAVKQK